MSSDTAGKRRFTPEELARLPEFHHPRVGPDGERVAFYYDGTGRNELYVQDVETGERRQLSDGEVPRAARWPIAWGADGDRVFFHLDDAGDEQNDIWALTLDGDAEPVVETPGQATLQDVADDGRLLYGSDEGEQLNLYLFDPDTGASEQLTENDEPVRAGSFSPDGDRIAYATNETEAMENEDAYVLDLETGDSRRLDLGETGSQSYPVDWHPDGERLLVRDDAEDFTQAGVYDLDADSVRWLGDGSAEESSEAFGPDGETAYVLRSESAGREPIVYDLDGGGLRDLDLAEGVASLAGGEHFLADGRPVFTQTTPESRASLLAYDGGATETLIEPDYGDIDPDAFVDAEYVTYESADGMEIGALLYDARDRPAGSEDEVTPGVVKVHGGPHGQSMQSFDLYAQFLVSQGYSVLLPNYRGSVGRGREFQQAILGDWGGAEQEDVAAGGRWLGDREFVDADRLAVFGGSYGGYSAYCQLTMHPEIWTTGVAWIGITDLELLYEESMPHFKATLEQQLGDPEENADLWRDRSPITHVGNMQAPVFVVHGVNDPRCPISQARTFRDALRNRGWEEGPDGDFEYEELEAEGHGSSDVEQKVRAFGLIGEFLERRL
ncbi:MULTISPECIES: S9 family peptidase [Halolamina]|uniref:Dipeptidyl aminopeptidase/acylaminoacyl peptidase n=1 Tax=Halolamina pelagica TaxID=699431 RepID=A0A1I5SV68_9EURY|nr:MULTISPECIES: S9 family peptidase [Halolamina]NHX36876.1 S9 family peptidase [Halolamina sp. R1-12]SFP74714.1 Dipeptidyl aminopeptidase/acylaminoacyl peptidase [Halolamina pelagica]